MQIHLLVRITNALR